MCHTKPISLGPAWVLCANFFSPGLLIFSALGAIRSICDVGEGADAAAPFGKSCPTVEEVRDRKEDSGAEDCEEVGGSPLESLPL